MQLDKTQIAIRERTAADTMDLALHVLRVYFWPFVVAMLLGVVPFALANELLIGWMTRLNSDAVADAPWGVGAAHYIWTMAVLVVLEAPLASVFATTYLGHAVFMDRPSIRSVVRDVRRVWPQLAWCQLLARGVLPAMLLAAMVDRFNAFTVADWLMITLLALVCLQRVARPFVNEIILLERSPLSAKGPNTMTVSRRSAMLHKPSSGDLANRWFVSTFYATILAVALFGAVPTLQRILVDQATPGIGTIRVGWPLVLWSVAGFFTIVRFLNYLDLRIRHEGWEVELRIRAEGGRLAESVR